MKHKPYGPYEKYIKRPQDFLCALLATIILSPVLLITAILVRIKLGSPVLFIQDRPGRDGKIFKLYKFRTMTDERDENGELLPDDVSAVISDDVSGVLLCCEHDAADITSVSASKNEITFLMLILLFKKYHSKDIT